MVALLITGTILVVGYEAARSVGQRLLDAVDPSLVAQIRVTATGVAAVRKVTEVRARWVGHRIFAEVRLSVDASSSLTMAHSVAETVQHALLHALPKLSDAIIHVDPDGSDETTHQATYHHRESR